MRENSAVLEEREDATADNGKSEASNASGRNLSQEERGKPEKARPIDFILDIPLGISVELGRTRMVVNDLLQLGPGSIVELNKSAGEPMEILINNKLVARGEVIVVNEKLAVRLTDIVSPIERIESFNYQP
ncbi:MAG: flagellar motor switch protein FliN [Deltaproteobacteria bacterium]|jgi:flagellar motor switch protein FliN/FliY|nr:flagellar motor switch protein FliN [Deltaproteobacteria bacterium]